MAIFCDLSLKLFRFRSRGNPSRPDCLRCSLCFQFRHIWRWKWNLHCNYLPFLCGYKKLVENSINMYWNCPERQSLDFYFVKASATVIFTVIISYFYAISPGNGLFETLILHIQRYMSLLCVHLPYFLAQPIFETLIFVITIQKASSELLVSNTSLVQYQ